ncbi:CBS domain-containing protein [Pyrofollis japonicus]|uniref:CBS domain-containing protein n=1 Tax=Pyrofollis japonicus TaxID=3060460 RepID=UPI00295AC978|nr:CBS domain-containing protein [Pyrofollis japonicus]BEP17880.1 CBS domain-containing protein [Pyrofollis japonicus]
MSRRLILLGHYPPPVVLEEGQSLLEAMVALDQRGVRHAVVVDQRGCFLGIFSIRRLLGELLEGYEKGDLAERLESKRVEEVARRDAPRFVVGEFDMEQVIETMAEKNIGAVVVTDSSGCVLGIISEKHITGAMALSSINAAVHEIMSRPVHSLPLEASVADALRLMVKHRHRHAPVVDNENRLEAIVSARDILALLASEQSLEMIRRGEADKVYGLEVLRIAVGAPATIRPSSDISTALRIMRKRGVSALPVVDEGYHVIGIVTERDFVTKLPKLMGVELFYDLARSKLYVARVVA